MSKVEIGPNNCRRIISSAGISGCEVGKTRVSYLLIIYLNELDWIGLDYI